jgi:hypothetical protein
MQYRSSRKKVKLVVQPKDAEAANRIRLRARRIAVRLSLAAVLLGIFVGIWFAWTGSRFSSTEASQAGLERLAFLPSDPQIDLPCSGEGCSPDWRATGRDGIDYRLVRVAVENRRSPLVLALPEALLDRFPFPECDVTSNTSALAGVARPPPGQAPRPVGCRSGAVSRIALVARLPGFVPAGRPSLFGKDERDDVVTMVIDVSRENADFRRGIAADRSGGLETWLTAWSTAMARKGYIMARKTPSFGLNRLGPEHGLVGRDAAILSDVMYTGPVVGGSSDVLMCTVEEALMDDGQSRMGQKAPQATCWHWFAVTDLGLDVRLSYDRSKLPDWRVTREAALTQVRHFARIADPQR